MLVTAAGSTHWWFIGIAIGFAIVLVVVIVASTILALAGRIGNQAKEGIVLMDEARQFTVPVWEVQRTNALLTVIWKSAEAARECMQGTQPEGRR